MFVSVKKTIDKIYKTIDKIAKIGDRNYIEYTQLIDKYIKTGQWGLFTQTLLLKYNFDHNKYNTIDELRRVSWKQILSKTKTKLDESKYSIMKKMNIYQLALNYFKETEITLIKINTETGSGAELKPIIVDGELKEIKIIKPGKNYSTTDTIEIIGGSELATVDIEFRSGRFFKIDVLTTGKDYDKDIFLGTVEEIDVYNNEMYRTITSGYEIWNRFEDSAVVGYTDSEFQAIIGNKIMILKVSKNDDIPIIFNNWKKELSFDRNVTNLYKSALNYLNS
jgi:hypothetical protein